MFPEKVSPLNSGQTKPSRRSCSWGFFILEKAATSLHGRDRGGVLYGYLASPGRVGTAFSTPQFSHLSVKGLAWAIYVCARKETGKEESCDT